MSAASVISENNLKQPTIDLYSGDFSPIPTTPNANPTLRVISQTQNEENLSNIGSSSMLASESFVSTKSLVDTQTEHEEILTSLINKIKSSKPLPPEFYKIIEDNFWDLF